MNSTTLNLVAVPWLTGTYVASVSKRVASPTPRSGSDFGNVLTVSDGAGMAFGSLPICPADSLMFNSNTSVTNIPASSNPTALMLSQNIHDFAAQDTLVTFYFAYGSGSTDSNTPPITPAWSGSDPSFSFNLIAKGKSTDVLTFNHTAPPINANTSADCPSGNVISDTAAMAGTWVEHHTAGRRDGCGRHGNTHFPLLGGSRGRRGLERRRQLAGRQSLQPFPLGPMRRTK